MGDDVYRLSASIDAEVEAKVTLTEFVSAVASHLNRLVETYVYGQCLRALPGTAPQRSHLDPGQLTLATADIDVRIDPPLPEPAAKFIRQRLIHAVRLITHYDDSGQATEGADDQLRLLLSAVGPEERRTAVRRRLGFPDGVALTVVAIAGAAQFPAASQELAGRLGHGTPLASVQVGGVLAVILRQEPDLTVGIPIGLAIGVGEPFPPERLHESWHGATTALRFSQPSKRARGPYTKLDAVVVTISDVGPMRVLAEAVDHAQVRDLADLKILRQLAETGPPDTLSVLEAVSATESIRQAAKLVHLHHNTVAQRVESAETALGFSFRGSYGRSRLLVGLTLHRLSSSSLPSEAARRE